MKDHLVDWNISTREELAAKLGRSELSELEWDAFLQMRDNWDETPLLTYSDLADTLGYLCKNFSWEDYFCQIDELLKKRLRFIDQERSKAIDNPALEC